MHIHTHMHANTHTHTHAHTHTHTCTHTHTLTGAFNQYLANRKNKLVQSMLQVFGVYFHPYVTLYDDFYALYSTFEMKL